ncbi:MAG: type 3 dihydrofolate reductase [Proteobacteria bacterium]|nr:type 3 dihydrofolate reductase [Pseudomonadota bacterium]
MISLVVAMTENGVIGHDNRLLWHLPNDLKHFKALTLNKPIIMGRRTYESIGKPLPGRQNIILTHARYLQIPQCDIVHSVNEALDITADAAEMMVIGGGEIYRLFLPLATYLYITYVHANIEGDTSFPLFDPSQWQEVSRQKYHKDEKHLYDYSFVAFKRRQDVLK